MDHSKHARLTADELTAEILEDATIYGPADQKIGSVVHIHSLGPSAHVVIDVGGFLDIGTKLVGVPLGELDFMRDENGNVHAATGWTKDQLKAMPEHRDR